MTDGTHNGIHAWMVVSRPVRALAPIAEKAAADAERDGSVEEHAWVEHIRAGDLAAFEALFRRHYDGLIAFSQMLGLELSASEEVVQEVLMRVWTARAQWEVRATVASYLYGAVRNRVISIAKHDRVARRWATADRDQLNEVTSSGPSGGSEQLEMQELTQVVREAIATLPERCRTTYLLSREQGLTYTEIAEAMGTSVKTVNNQMTRAMTVLRQAVRRWEG